MTHVISSSYIYMMLLIYISIATTIVTKVNPEPKCYSRFDYDHKVLQNLVQLQKSDEDVKKITSHVQSELQELKTEITGFPSTIAFMAELSKNTAIPAMEEIHQMIVFDKIHTNFGNAYNNLTGAFLAPYNGAYQFNLEISIPNGTPGQVFHIIIAANGERAGYIFFVFDSHLWVRKTTSVTLGLSKGDTVQAVIVLSSGTKPNIIAGCCFHSHFSGFLIGRV